MFCNSCPLLSIIIFVNKNENFNQLKNNYLCYYVINLCYYKLKVNNNLIITNIYKLVNKVKIT